MTVGLYGRVGGALLLALGAVSCGGGDAVTLQGSGASFPAPLYSRWFNEYNRKDSSVRINYQPTGSGAGIKAFIAGQTDFGASDAAMSDEEMARVEGGVLLLPMTAGSIVLAYNLPGVEGVRLSRDAYAGMFLGEVTSWNDPRIAAANPGVALPDTPVTIVRRSDGSGTTYVFTKHLGEISPAWRDGPGTGKSVDWPVGVGGKKNDGVAALINQTPGGIGYVELGFAAQTGLPTASLENKAGKYVAPTLESAQTALANVTLPADMRAWLPDPSGDGSYPIVTYTWLLVHPKYEDPKVSAALKKVLRYCLTDGQKLSAELHYVPLPESVANAVLKALDRIS